MKRLVFAVLGATAFACGPSLESDKPKSPDEIVAEQEALGAEQQKKSRGSSDFAGGSTDEEKGRQWDPAYAALELRRASRSAETCPESVTEKTPKGKAKVTLHFQNDGRTKDTTVDAPYADTAVGKCVLRAMGAVIVKTFEGEARTVHYEVDLTGGKKSGPIDGLDESKSEEKSEEE